MQDDRVEERVALIGPGVLGSALALELHRVGYRISALGSRRPERHGDLASRLGCRVYDDPARAVREADIVFLAVPDAVVGEVAQAVALHGGFSARQVVFHLSGALEAEVLSAARGQGAEVAALHPLQTFADVDSARRGLRTCWFAVEGDDSAVRKAQEIVGRLGAKAFVIDAAAKPLYHAALCMASNYLVTLEALAFSLLERAGIPPKIVREAPAPLLRTTIENLLRLDPPEALTGPIARGDTPTVRRHLGALRRQAPEVEALYRCLGLATLDLAEKKGTVDKEKLYSMRDLLWGSEPKQGG